MAEICLELGKRKIQLIHGSAFLNLPKTWVKTNHLRKGDKVSIDLQEDGTLKISPLTVFDGGDDLD